LEHLILGKDQEMSFFKPNEVKSLKIAFQCKTVFEEYFVSRTRNLYSS